MKRAILFLLFLLSASFLKANPTVVCLHGFLSDHRSMNQMKVTLEKCGFEVCLWDYPSRRYTFECHATHLITQLQEIARCKPGEPIHFVAHSIAALIVRSALNLPGCPEEAKMGKVVLIAPPNQGSCLARSMKDSMVARMTVGSASGRELMTMEAADIERCFGNFPESMPVLVIAGCQGVHTWFTEPNDGYLTVEETRLNTPHEHVVFPLTHSTLLTACPALSCVAQFLMTETKSSETKENQ